MLCKCNLSRSATAATSYRNSYTESGFYQAVLPDPLILSSASSSMRIYNNQERSSGCFVFQKKTCCFVLMSLFRNPFKLSSNKPIHLIQTIKLQNHQSWFRSRTYQRLPARPDWFQSPSGTIQSEARANASSFGLVSIVLGM